VRDRELAADVVQTTFAKAWAACQSDKEVRSVKAWLYVIARNAAIDELRARKPLDPVEDMAVFAQVDGSRMTNPQAAIDDRELAELVWDAAAALSPQDYSLLHMHLVRDLGADELAEKLGLRKNAVYTRVSRLKDSLAEAVVVTLLIRRGRRECPELDALLDELHAGVTATPEVRAAVSRHVETCERCQETRRKLVSPVEIFGALAPVPATPGLMDEIWKRIAAGIGQADHVTGIASLRGRRRRGLVVAVMAGILVAAGASSAVLTSRGGGVRVEDPRDVHSTSHRIGVPSSDRVIVMAWTKPRDAVGYSVRWTRSSEGLPDEDVDSEAAETLVRSPQLRAGRWWFNLRTKAENGQWTSTVHAGPYVVEAMLQPPERAVPPAAKAEQAPKPPEKNPKPPARASPKKLRQAPATTTPAATTPTTTPTTTTPTTTTPTPTTPTPTTTTSTSTVVLNTTATGPPAVTTTTTPIVTPAAPAKRATTPPPERAVAPRPELTLDVHLAGPGTGSVTGARGISCGTTCSATFAPGSVVTLTTTANESSTFAGWSGACSGTGACSLTIRSRTSVTARFDLRHHSLTVAPAGSGSGAVTSTPAGIECGATCSATYEHGAVVTLTATAGSDSTFGGWSGACSATGSCTVTMRGAASVTATFDRKRHTLTVALAGGGGGSVTSNAGGIACGGACAATYDHGTLVTLTAAPDGGSHFAGWGGACSGTGPCAVTLAEPTSVTAEFIPVGRA
jgi:RNA polymerase sigma factor (sigma-70 family)